MAMCLPVVSIAAKFITTTITIHTITLITTGTINIANQTTQRVPVDRAFLATRAISRAHPVCVRPRIYQRR